MIRTSETTAAISAAIHRAQGSTLFAAAYRQNTATNSKYANLADILAAVQPILTENGLSILAFPGPIRSEGGIHAAGLTARLCHTSGEWMEADGEFPLPPPPKSRAGNDILNYSQTHGLAMTYARRYWFVSIFNISTGNDDDGQRLSARSHFDRVQDASSQVAPADPGEWKEYRDLGWQDQEFEDGRTYGSLSKAELASMFSRQPNNPALVAWCMESNVAALAAMDWTYSDAVRAIGGKWPASLEDFGPTDARLFRGAMAQQYAKHHTK